jgi:hypothetical protein
MNCGSDASQLVDPGTKPAVFTIAVDSSTLLVGHLAHVSITAKDSAGHVIASPSVNWTSLSPLIATISASGTITALSSGPARIQASVSGATAVDSLTVVVPPDLASTNFDDGTVGSIYTYGYTSADLSFPVDPTNSGRGKVARFHYAKIGVDDINRSMEYRHNNSFGQTLYFRGEFYIPVGSPMTDGTYQRKLLYWLPHVDYTKYGSNGNGGPAFWSLVTMFGDGLFWNGVMVAQNSANNIDIMARLATITPGQWYTIEKQLTPESSIGAKDGVVRIWLNGNLVFTKTNMQWTDPAWIGQPVPNGNGTPLQASDVYFQRYEFGDQVNYSGTFDEYRYWDQVAFSSTRIGN